MNLVGIDTLAKSPLADGDVLIGGRWLPAADGRTYPVHDPATGALVREVSSAGPGDAFAAIEAADRAAAAWRATPARRRSEVLHDTFRLMREHTDLLAGLIVLENGKAYRDAAAEVGYAAEFFRWFAEEAVRIGSSFGDARAVVSGMSYAGTRSASPRSSLLGTSRPPWPPARSPPPSRPAAPSCSSPPPRRRSPPSRWPRCSPRPDCPRDC